MAPRIEARACVAPPGFESNREWLREAGRNDAGEWPAATFDMQYRSTSVRQSADGRASGETRRLPAVDDARALRMTAASHARRSAVARIVVNRDARFYDEDPAEAI
jgi:hypothetical protein